jgi:predicted AAA+ superfamily ATPase
MDNSLLQLVDFGAARIASVKMDHKRSIVQELRVDDRLQIILGARGVGKTTCLLQFAKGYLDTNTAVYLSLDDGYFGADNLIEVVDDLRLEGYTHFIFDEVHRYKNWSQQIKVAYDRYPSLHFLLTGSSVSKLSEGDADLSRRAIRLSLEVLSWREWMLLNQQMVLPKYTVRELIKNAERYSEEITSLIKDPVKSFRAYMRRGCYPYALENQDETRYLQRLRTSAMTAIDVDVVPAGNASTETARKLKRLLVLIAAGSPYTININTVANQLATSRNQVYQMLDLLEGARLIRRLWMSGKTPKTLAKPEKIYLNNPNLAHALAVSDVGHLRECAFITCTQPLGDLFSGGEVWASNYADFEIDTIHFEVGGSSKKNKQIQGLKRAYRVLDGEPKAFSNVIPLYLFGCLS